MTTNAHDDERDRQNKRQHKNEESEISRVDAGGCRNKNELERMQGMNVAIRDNWWRKLRDNEIKRVKYRYFERRK